MKTTNQTLAVAWRPKCFQDVIGQEVVVSVLSRQVETKTFKNAYLFCGPSGCGKTTTARILADEINGHEGSPIEIDAASNNGVDNIRSLIVDAQQTSIDSNYKVYVSEECHMLTNAAWNASLKLIEEPPTNSIFIFCTTDPQKIPETILSRVQRFDFLRISTKEIADRLEFILNEEYVTDFERPALDRIASMANGFMRESLSLLDKCISYSEKVTLDNVEKVLGLVKYDALFDLTDAIYNKQGDKAVEILRQIKAQHSNLLSVVDNILQFFIDCAKYQKTNNIELTNLPRAYKDRLVYNENLMVFVDRTFKYRQLSNTVSADMLLDLIVLDLCAR